MTSSLTVAVCAIVMLHCARFGQSQETLDDAQLDKLTAELFNLEPVSKTATTNPYRDKNGVQDHYFKRCVCVPNYLCKNTSVVPKGENYYIDSRIPETHCQEPEVCCQSDPIYPSASTESNTSGVDPKPSDPDSNPSDVEAKPSGDEPKPSGFEPKPSSLDPDPSGVEPKPSGDEPKPSGLDPILSGDEPKPSGDEPKPNGVESRPSGIDPNLSSVESKPSSVESKPSSVEPYPSSVEPKPSECGYRNLGGFEFRVNDTTPDSSKFGEFPWMVAVLREESIDGQAQGLNVYQCGGALIHPQAVITAAHCVVDKAKQDSLKIRAGEWDTQTTEEVYPYQDRSVSKVIVHEQFYSGGLFNDIALLILEQPVEIADNVNIVCLPPQGTVTQSGTRCFATGWGKSAYGQEGLNEVILKKIELPIVGHDACQEELRKTRMGKLFELHSSFTCAGGEGKDTCKGDGGSPLVCPIEGQSNRYYHAGIVAWGIGCAKDNIPGVYVDVAKFISWINEHMISNQFDINVYSYA